MSGPFKLKSGNSPLFKQMGSTMKQTEEEPTEKIEEKKIDDLADVLGLIPGMKHVGKVLSDVKKKIHESEFAQKHLIGDPTKEPELSKVGEFVKKYIYDPK